MFGLCARMLKRMAATASCLYGRVAFRLGRHATSRRAFERVLRLSGDEFLAHVYLGRIALGEGDFAGYRREMASARALDAERFAGLRPAAEGIEPRLVGSPFEETGERATWRSVRPGNHGIARRSTVRSAEIPTESLDEPMGTGPLFDLPHAELSQQDTQLDAPGSPDLALPGAGGDPRARQRLRDDFSSGAERDRFRQLPPLRQDDVRTADFDELARRLGS